MSRIHRVEFNGRLGRDPELRYTQNGRAVIELNVAVNDSYKPKESEEWVDKTTWYTCTFWGEAAEKLNELGLQKGDEVFVEGRPELQLYEKKDGTQGAKIAVMNPNLAMDSQKRRAQGDFKAAPEASEEEMPAAEPPKTEPTSKKKFAF